MEVLELAMGAADFVFFLPDHVKALFSCRAGIGEDLVGSSCLPVSMRPAMMSLAGQGCCRDNACQGRRLFWESRDNKPGELQLSSK